MASQQAESGHGSGSPGGDDAASLGPGTRPPSGHSTAGQKTLLLTACVLGLGALIETSKSFQACEHTLKNGATYRALRETVGLLAHGIIRLELHTVCARATAADNDGSIVALATIVLAGFTYALWRSTEKLWWAGDAQLQAFKQSLTDSKAAAAEQNHLMGLQIAEAKTAAEAAVLSANAALGVELPRLALDKAFFPAFCLSVERKPGKRKY